MPFHEIDGLVLSAFLYLKLEALPLTVTEPYSGTEDRSVPLVRLERLPGFHGLFADPIFGSGLRRLYEAMVTGQRFRNVRLAAMIHRTDRRRKLQLCAATFRLTPGLTGTFFRGTDESFTGWEENLSMGRPGLLPSQQAALSYVRPLLDRYPGRHILGGHSKGGSLAVSTASLLPPAEQNRICTVYTYDNPGFHRDFYRQEGFRSVSGRIFRVIPQSSLVGTLFCNAIPTHIVKSWGSGLYQHDPFTWDVAGGQFCLRPRLCSGAAWRGACINRLLERLTEEQTGRLSRILEECIARYGLTSVYDLGSTPETMLRKLVILCLRHVFHKNVPEGWKSLRHIQQR